MTLVLQVHGELCPVRVAPRRIHRPPCSDHSLGEAPHQGPADDQAVQGDDHALHDRASVRVAEIVPCPRDDYLSIAPDAELSTGSCTT